MSSQGNIPNYTIDVVLTISLDLEAADPIIAEVAEMTDTDLVAVVQIDTVLVTEIITDEAVATLAPHLPTATVVAVAILALLVLLLLEGTAVAHHLETFLLAETIAAPPLPHHRNKSQLLTHQRIVRSLKMKREIE